MSIQNYDQWKTASPYDDDIDPIEEGERFLKENKAGTSMQLDYAISVIEALLAYIDEEV